MRSQDTPNCWKRIKTQQLQSTPRRNRHASECKKRLLFLVPSNPHILLAAFFRYWMTWLFLLAKLLTVDTTENFMLASELVEA